MKYSVSVKLKQYGSTRIFQLNRCRGFLLDLQRLLSYRTQSQNTSDYWEKKAAIESVFLLVKVQRIEMRAMILKSPFTSKWTLHRVAGTQQQADLVSSVSPCAMLYKLPCWRIWFIKTSKLQPYLHIQTKKVRKIIAKIISPMKVFCF